MQSHFGIWVNLVLIETLWNVKTGTYILCIDGHVGINRNIVECKDCPQSMNSDAF